MIPIDYDLGKRIVETCTCECGAFLTLPWGGAWGIESYVIKCPVDPSHDKVVPVKSLYKMWKDGEELPSFIKDSIERKERRSIMEQNEVKEMVVKVELPSVYSTIPSLCPWCGVAVYRIFDELGDWMIYEKEKRLKQHTCEPFNQWVEANKDILGFTPMSLCRTRWRLWLAGREVAERWLKELQNQS